MFFLTVKNIGSRFRVVVGCRFATKPASLPTFGRTRRIDSTSRNHIHCKSHGREPAATRGLISIWFHSVWRGNPKVLRGCLPLRQKRSRRTGHEPIRTLPRPVKTTGIAWTVLGNQGCGEGQSTAPVLLRTVGLLEVNSACVTRMRYNTLRCWFGSIPRAE